VSAESNPSSSNENKPARIEDILLERLKNEPKTAQQISPIVLIAILIGVIGIGVGIYFISLRPEKFAVNPHAQEDQKAAQDSSLMYSKRLKFQPMMDSLTNVIAVDPNNDEAHLMLANVYYETEFWQKAKPEYELYLSKHPEDVNARVDYAYVIAQSTGDFKAAVTEINKGLKYEPEHVNALFNAGLLSIQANLDDKKKAITEATSYFSRALSAAKRQGDDKMADQIGQILAKLKEPEKSSEP
jgi:tetratricopeptide (TPR) repeat protein